MRRILPLAIVTIIGLSALGSFAVFGGTSSGAATQLRFTTNETPPPSPEPPETGAEPAEATEAADPAEPEGTADVGHADDPADPNADHQFDGEE